MLVQLQSRSKNPEGIVVAASTLNYHDGHVGYRHPVHKFRDKYATKFAFVAYI